MCGPNIGETRMIDKFLTHNMKGYKEMGSDGRKKDELDWHGRTGRGLRAFKRTFKGRNGE